MPSAVFIPAQLNDLATDVNVGTPARGAVLYRGASVWNALAAGAAGRVLTSNGAGADPSWNVVASADLSPAVILAPASDTRNLIQPTGDFKGLVLRGSASQTVNIQEWQISDGSVYAAMRYSTVGATAAEFRLGGDFPMVTFRTIGGSETSYISANTGSGTVDFAANSHFSIVDHATAIVAVRFRVDSVVMIGQGPPASIAQVTISNTYASNPILAFQAHASQSGDLWRAVQSDGSTVLASVSSVGAGLFRPLDAATNAITTALTLGHNTSGTPAAGFGNDLRFQLESSTTENRDAAGLSAEWATATDASRKARVKLTAFDTAAREVMRGGTDGSNPLVGFLGAAEVARQTLAAAATDAATTQTLANSLRTALINLGLGA